MAAPRSHVRISGANGTLAVSRGHVELRDRFGHPVAQLRPEAPSVAYALRRAAKGVVGEVAEDVKPEEALKETKITRDLAAGYGTKTDETK